jgi:proline iminopeptidase
VNRGILSGAIVASLWSIACTGSGPATTAPEPQAGGLATGEHHVVVNDVRLWYRVAGETPTGVAPVVFLHGGPGQGSQSFAALAGPHLEPLLRMVYLDQRGSGRSERPWDRAYSVDLLVEDLEAVRRELGVDRISLIGQSFGAVPALEYAARYPEHVERMVIAAGLSDVPATMQAGCERLRAVHPALYEASMEEARAQGAATCNLFNAIPDQAQRQAFFDTNMFPVLETELLIELHDTLGGLRNTGELGGEIFQQGFFEWRFAGHDRLTMPVLVIAGALDYQIGLGPQRALADALPDATLLIYEGAGHFMYVDQPDRFARDVGAFFGGERVE